MTRRFLRNWFTVGVLVILLLPFQGCSRTDGKPLTKDALLLGTVIRVSVYDPGYRDELLDRVMERVTTIEARMSTSRDDYDDTELLRVNADAGISPQTVSDDTMYVLEEALHFSRLTSGAFDVTIGPLVDLWGIGTDHARVPTWAEIEAILPLIDYGAVVLDEDAHTVYLPNAGMGLDVGGIAKGYAADEAASILRDAGVTSALLDFGGNILVIGSKPDGSAWRVGIQRPDAQRSEYVGILSIRDATVVTSGPYERYFEENGVRYHHILDADTGYPAEKGLSQVTIITKRSIEADALSTACYVLGRDDALALIEGMEGVEAILADTEKNLYPTSGIGSMFTPTDDDYKIGTPN